MRFSLLPPTLLLCMSMCFTAAAQDDAPSQADIKKAAQQYDFGRERFREGNYVEAAEKFEAADDFAPSAAALRLAMAARQEAGQSDRAATHAALALERYPGEEPIAGEAQELIDQVGGELGKLTVECDSPCSLLLNNRIVHGSAAEKRVLYVEPGSIQVRAGWSHDRSESQSVELAAGSDESISFYAPEIPPEPVAEPAPAPVFQESDPVADKAEPASGWHPAVFWTGVGLTAAAGGATVFLGLNAKNNPGRDAVIENCAPMETDCPEYQQGLRNQMYANIAAGSTAAIGVFTIITGAFLTDWSGGDDSASSAAGSNVALGYKSGDLSIHPTFAVGDGALLGATGTF